MKNPKSVSVFVHGMEGRGPTKPLAQQDAKYRLTAAMALNYRPAVFTCVGKDGPITGLVWYTPTGVASAYIHDDTGEARLGGICYHGAFKSVDEAEADFARACYSMRLSLAQLTADVESNQVPQILNDNHDGLRNDLVGYYAQWLGFQRAYRSVKSSYPNVSEPTWHRMACDLTQQFTPAKSDLHFITGATLTLGEPVLVG